MAMQPAETRPQHSKLDKTRQQRNVLQKKEQAKYPQDEINEEQIGNLPQKDFRVMIVKRIQDLKNRVQARIEKVKYMFNQDLEELDMTEGVHFHFSLSCIGEGNGNPLQCSCLENPRDGGA